MLDARRTTLQLPLRREVTALQKIRTLQDPGTSSSVTSGGSSGTGKNKKVKTFIGDPHKDAQALAIELSGKLAKSAKVPSLSDGAINRPPKLQPKGEKSNVRADKLQKRRAMKAMTAEELGNDGDDISNGRQLSDPEMEPIKVDVRERIKRIESAFERSSSVTVSGELRKEGLIKELKARGRRDANHQTDDLVRSDDRWDGGLARREELARKVVEEQRGSSISSLAQLLGNHYGSSRSAFDLLGMVADEEHRNDFEGEGLFESDEELSPMEIEMSRPRMVAPPPLMSRGKDELKKPRTGRARTRKKPGSARVRERSTNLARPRSGKSSARLTMRDPPPPSIILDDELAVTGLPEQNGCGIQWDWSRIHKYGGKAFLDLTGLTCTVPEGAKQPDGIEPLMAEHHHNPPVQSISSLDSDANALPLIIGEDAHDSDLAGYYIETGRPREIPQRQAPQGKRKPSLQNAVKDVPVVPETGSTSRPRDDAPLEGHRTLTQKYRPKNFREIVGQAVVVKSLSIAIVKSKVAPVYLFMGPRGTGKTSAARVFAAGLNCLSPDYGRRPCGLCRECGTMALNRSADVRQIDAASNVDLGSMRAMMGSFTPHARYKVFIVEGCDLLSIDIWNAFLKVLEEPPRNVVFVLITTDAERIPVTATSRCQKFLFSKLKESDIVKRLELLARKEGLVVESGVFTLIAARSDGSLRDAEIILDQLCLLDKNVSVALFQELVGILPDSQVLDLLDHALSANTVGTVRTLREVLASGVEPLVLVSQLGSLITDILVGSLEIDRGARKEGFFNRNISAKEEQHRLRLALKILSDAEKQLRVAADRTTWLTAALLQFAPDRSFLPSQVNTSSAPSPIDPGSASLAVNYPVYNEDPSEPEEAQLAPEHAEPVGESFEAHAESKKNPSPDPSPEDEENVITLSEQKLEEAWAGEPQQQVVVEDDGELSGTQREAEHPVEFQVFQEEALSELWKRVVLEVAPRNLKNLLQTHGRLVAAGVAVDGSCAVVELEFDYAKDKHKAERSWRSICIAFQAVLSTAVELRIALSDIAPDVAEAARIGETMVDMEPSPSAQPKSKEIVAEEDPNPEAEVIDQAQGAPSRPRHRRRGHKSRRHQRHPSEFVSSSDPSGITPRRPPNRRRRVKRAGAGKAVKQVIPTFEIETVTQDSTSFTREIWDSISMDRKPQEKKPLSTHMEEPQSEIEDLQSAQKKIMKQRANHVQFRNDSSLAIIQQGTLVADLQRGLPKESVLCWKSSPAQSEFELRKARVKSVKKSQGKATLLRLVPCRNTGITQKGAPASTAPVSAIKAA
ncbi:hypothetical protein KC19_4G123000 [Ceratodon purpureus]|uniref:STICHEL DnaA-N-like alpha-beta domain-containing protein n=1 Tax=Ceratodon purpureus TaxID=3225 RepID=A0A8T0I9Z1_CERPU|nr:hypothetical protein KC19_4G123000 [Ceratodon purpureus]